MLFIHTANFFISQKLPDDDGIQTDCKKRSGLTWTVDYETGSPERSRTPPSPLSFKFYYIRSTPVNLTLFTTKNNGVSNPSFPQGYHGLNKLLPAAKLPIHARILPLHKRSASNPLY